MIEVTDVHKTFFVPHKVKALVGVSTKIAAGEVVVVIGPSGSGKSTIMQLMLKGIRCKDPEYAIKAEEDTLDLKGDWLPVWFNAWKYPNDDTVLAGLLGALLDAYRQGGLLDQLGFHVGNHKQRLAQTVLHAAAPWAFGKPGDAKAWGRISQEGDSPHGRPHTGSVSD